MQGTFLCNHNKASWDRKKKQNGKEKRPEQKGIDNIATFRFD